jgi:hypothetical protein
MKRNESMNEEISILIDVTSRLEKAGIHYMMTGSMALAVYSTPRMTRDIRPCTFKACLGKNVVVRTTIARCASIN